MTTTPVEPEANDTAAPPKPEVAKVEERQDVSARPPEEAAESTAKNEPATVEATLATVEVPTPQEDEGAPPILSSPLQVDDRCPVRWRDEKDQYLDAVVIHRRHRQHRKRKQGGPPATPQHLLTVSDESNEPVPDGLEDCRADELEYYVHYINHDRRLDEWVHLDKFQLESLQRASEVVTNHHSSHQSPAADEPTGRRRRRSVSEHADDAEGGDHEHASDLLTGGNWHGEDPTLEREHEAATKVKNIESIILGPWEVETWYYSPFPPAYCDLKYLYFCEFCLTYMKKYKTYKKHNCGQTHPPGREIYRYEGLAVYEIDGKEQRAYCQKLCLLAKLFLDHKTLYFETKPFLFYVVTKVDDKGSHIVGYFSKEKNSSEGYNLACILTLPQYQKLGFGSFIISLSYEITKREGKTGSPEKPLSDLGKVSYRSYWTHILLTYLARHTVQVNDDTSVNKICMETGIRTEDLISTLQHLDMIKVWKGQHVIYVQQSMLREYMKKGKKMRLCNSQYLKWTPPAETPVESD